VTPNRRLEEEERGWVYSSVRVIKDLVASESVGPIRGSVKASRDGVARVRGMFSVTRERATLFSPILNEGAKES